MNTNKTMTRSGRITLRMCVLPAAISAALLAYPAAANPNPSTGQVVSGQANFNQTGKVLTVTNTPGTVINWQNFSIASDETTRFLQQSSSSWVLNRIVGQDPSQIFGALQSNGKVFLINPNGVMFGNNARVDTAGLVASSLNLDYSGISTGNWHFQGDAKAGSVINQGRITTPGGGQVFLIAPHVENSGIITSAGGDVILAAGHEVKLVDSNDPSMHVVISAPSDQAINLGQVVSQGGRIGIYGALVNQRGIVSADSAVVGQDGKVLFKASVTTTLEAGSSTTANGAGNGGQVILQGDHVGLADGAAVHADGQTGGGTVLIGGDAHGGNPAVMNASATFVAANANVSADALSSGNGGKVVVWSNDATRAYGSFSAQGRGTGNGGFLETSGHYLDTAGVKVNVGATRGKAGTWLLDPYDITIGSGSDNINSAGSGTITYTGNGLTSFLSIGTLTSVLNTGSNVIVDTTGAGAQNGDITLNSALGLGLNSPATLTLKATRDVNINGAISNSGQPLTLVLNSDQTNIGTGNVNIAANITTSNGNLTVNGANTLNLNTSSINAGTGAIQFNAGTGGIVGGGAALSAASVTANAKGDVTLTGSNQTGSIAGTVTGSGNFGFSNATTPLTVNAISAPGNVFVAQTVAGDLTITGNVTAGASANINNTGSGNITHSVGTISAGNGAQLSATNGSVVVAGTLTSSGSDYMTSVAAPNGTVTVSGTVNGNGNNVSIVGGNGVNVAGTGHVTSNGSGISLATTGVDKIVTVSAGGEIENTNTYINLTSDKMVLDGMVCAMGGTGILSMLPVNSGVTLFISASSHTATAHTLELTNADLTNVAQSSTVIIGDNSRSGAAVFKNPLTASIPQLVVISTLGVTQDPGATIGVQKLAVQGYGVSLTEANTTSNIAGTSQMNAFDYRSANSIVVDSIGTYNGISSPTAIGLQSGAGGISQNAPLVTSGQGLVVKSGGNISLTNTGNQVGNFAADLTSGSGHLDFYNQSSFNVTGGIGSFLNSVSGISTSNQDARIEVPNTITVLNPIAVGSANVGIRADGLVLSSTVTGAQVNLQPSTIGRNITVGSATCASAPCLALYNLWEVNTPTLSVGTTDVNRIPGNIAVVGVTTGGSNATDINANTSRLGLLTGGSSGVSQTGPITVTDLGVEGGSVSLTLGNHISNVAASATASISVTSANNLNVTTLSGGATTDHYSLSGISGGTSMNLNSSGSITFTAPVNMSSAISVNAGGPIISGGGSITAAGISLTANGGIANGGTLTTYTGSISATNNATTGDINIGNTGALTIGSVTQPAVSSGNISIYNVGAVTVSGPISTDTGSITVAAHSPLTINGTVQSVGGGISLTAGASGLTTDKLTVSNGAVVNTSGAVTLSAGDAIVVNGTVNGTPVTKLAFQNTPPLPTIDQCIATPSLAGCSQVLPTLATCITAPTTLGCTVVLPTLAQCTTAPTTNGCAVVLPTLAQCIANPTAAGCTAVLPTVSQCVATPTAPGCNVVLPTLAQCIATPTTPGCAAILPTLTQCIASPTTAGCTVVLPTLAQCIATPTLQGCAVILPTLAQCITAPTTPGCTVVLPTIAQCTVTPTLPGCSVVLPTLAQCVTTPTLPGCAAVLPTLAQCVAAPTTAGCTVVLPSFAQCVSAPSTPGCQVILPTLAQCISSPMTDGCSAVLPSIADCTATPTLPGCSVVVPTSNACQINPNLAGCASGSDQGVNVGQNTTIALINDSNNLVTPNTIVGQQGDGKGGKGDKSDKSDNGNTGDNSKTSTGSNSKTGAKNDEPSKKLYCN